MRVLVASQNEVKRQATYDALQEFMPGCELEVVAPEIPIPSDVADQPMSHQVAKLGVENRIRNAKGLVAGRFTLYVAIESGCYRMGDDWFQTEFAGVANNGRVFHAHGPGVPMLDSFIGEMRKGTNLSDMMAKKTGIEDAGKKEGYTGWLAGENYSRRNMSKMAILFALCGMRAERG